jgi:hypothetical protein
MAVVGRGTGLAPGLPVLSKPHGRNVGRVKGLDTEKAHTVGPVDRWT